MGHVVILFYCQHFHTYRDNSSYICCTWKIPVFQPLFSLLKNFLAVYRNSHSPLVLVTFSMKLAFPLTSQHSVCSDESRRENVNVPLVYIELKVGTVLRGFLCILCLYIKSCFSNSKLSGQTVRWEVETQAGCVGGRKLLWSASLVCFFCVVCREMDHVNTSASCTFFLC